MFVLHLSICISIFLHLKWRVGGFQKIFHSLLETSLCGPPTHSSSPTLLRLLGILSLTLSHNRVTTQHPSTDGNEA